MLRGGHHGEPEKDKTARLAQFVMKKAKGILITGLIAIFAVMIYNKVIAPKTGIQA